MGDATLEQALRESLKFCEAMASSTTPAYWLTLLGRSGTGKTMLAKRIASFMTSNLDGLEDEHLTRPGESRIYRKGGFKPWVDVVGEVLSFDFSGVRQLKEDWFVCLDDIGAEYGTPRVKELASAKLFEILSAREGRFTLLTSNLDLQTIGTALDVRIASRLLRHGSVVVEILAPDFNLR